jgi:hypothetical protein
VFELKIARFDVIELKRRMDIYREGHQGKLDFFFDFDAIREVEGGLLYMMSGLMRKRAIILWLATAI